jgi:membrane-bound lytic murein transglycosylase B
MKKKKLTAEERKAARKVLAEARKAYTAAMRAAGIKRRGFHRGRRFTPAERRREMWDHDFDTLMHGLSRNPAALGVKPSELVDFAAQVADAMAVVQDARNPKRFFRRH